MTFAGQAPATSLPAWIRERKVSIGDLHAVKKRMRSAGLHTVCEEARCPNRTECFTRGTATFLINGRVCTRSCSYCAVAHGRPAALDPEEPAQLAEAARSMGLRHVVVTSVDRDDLADGGASPFVECVRLLQELQPAPTVEVLTPDFRGDMSQVDRILEAGPQVYNHNVETVARLYPAVRRSGRYEWALEVLDRVARCGREVIPKSGLMVGLGEELAEVEALLADLARVGCRIVTIGQYLQPTPRQAPVARYWHPEEFEDLVSRGEDLGLKVLAGPFVRSSYRAEETLPQAGRRP